MSKEKAMEQDRGSWLVRRVRRRYAASRRTRVNCGECLRPVPAGEKWCREHATAASAARREMARVQRVEASQGRHPDGRFAPMAAPEPDLVLDAGA